MAGGVKHPPDGHRLNDAIGGRKELRVNADLCPGFSPVISGPEAVVAVVLIFGLPRVSANSSYLAVISLLLSR